MAHLPKADFELLLSPFWSIILFLGPDWAKTMSVSRQGFIVGLSVHKPGRMKEKALLGFNSRSDGGGGGQESVSCLLT